MSGEMLLAAQARAHDLILVTDNRSEFERNDRLRVETWRTWEPQGGEPGDQKIVNPTVRARDNLLFVRSGLA